MCVDASSLRSHRFAGEEGDSSCAQSDSSTPRSPPQRRRPRTTWNEEARAALIQQVHHVKPYLMGHGQNGKGWEQVASDLSTLRPFAVAGGIKADSCREKYASMLIEHREKVAKGDWVSGRRDGESEVVHWFLGACMCEEQAMQEIRTRNNMTAQRGRGEKEEEKEARAEKLLEASLASAGSRSGICGESESRESLRKKRTTSSSSSYPSMEGIVAGYLASMSSSPDTKLRRKEIEASDAAARQQEAENRREEMAVRRLEVELRQQEMKSNQELRQQELKAIQETQKQTLELVSKLMVKLG